MSSNTTIYDKSTPYMALPMNIKRGNPQPLDTTDIWYSLADLQTYAVSATAYVGQICVVVDEANEAAAAYMIVDTSGNLVQLAQTTIGATEDVATIVANLQSAITALEAGLGAPTVYGQSGLSGYSAATGVYAVLEGYIKELQNLHGSTAGTLVGFEPMSGSPGDAQMVYTRNFKTVSQQIDEKVNDLDVAEVAVATVANDIITIHNIAETDGIIGQTGDGVAFAKVAKTGNAADVSIADANNRITATTVEGALDEIAGKISTVVGSDTTKSMRTVAAEEVAKIVDGANTSYDTLKEIADWIASDTTGAASMQSAISTLQTGLSGAESDIDALEAKTAGDFTVGSGDSATTTIKGYIDNKVANVSSTLGDLAVLDTVAEANLATDLATKINGKADKVTGATSGNFAGLDANGNLTDSGKKAADFATAAQGLKADNAVHKVVVSGTTYTLTEQSTGLHEIDIRTGSTNGTIAVQNQDVAVKGLGSAAYTETTAYDAAGAAATAKSQVIGTSSDTAASNTIYGVKAAITTTNANVTTNANAIAVLNGGDDVDGSVAKAVKAEKTRIDAVVGTPDSGKTLQGEIDALEALVGATGVSSQISSAVTAAVNDLDSTKSQTGAAANGGLSLNIVQTDGKIESISGSIAANTYDAYGSATAAKNEVIGTSSDTASSATITGLGKRAAAVEGRVSSLETIVGTTSVSSQIDAKINALDVSDAAVEHKFVTAVSEADGKISVTRAALDESDIPALAQTKITGLTGALADKQAKFSDGSAVIASVSNDVVTLKGGVGQSGGAISNSGNDVVLAKAAKTGAAVDISVTDSAGQITATNVEAALAELVTKIDSNTAAIGADNTESTVKYRIKQLETSVDTATTGLKARMTTAENEIDALQGAISGVFHYKGSATKTGTKLYVNTTEVTSPTVGDVYCVGQEEWAWDGQNWILLGTTTDLSSYYTKTEVDSKIGGISGALTFKGVLLNSQFGADGLPNISGMSNGDVWLNASGEQFAYNGTSWVKLGYLTDLSAYSTTSQVESMINGAISGLYKFKGSVADTTALNAIIGPATGDVYVVGTGNSQKQYAWSGTEWVEIVTNVDLSDYATTADVNSAIATAKAAAISTAAADADTERDVAKAYADTLATAMKGSNWTSDMTLASADSRLDSLEAIVGTTGTGLSDQVTAINTSLTDSGSIGSRIVALEAIDHDHTNKSVLDGITSTKVAAWDAAQTNVIETIQIGSTGLTVTNKTVTIPAFSSSTAGLVPVVGAELDTTAKKQKAFLNANGEWSVPTDARIGSLTVGSTSYSIVEEYVAAAIADSIAWEAI